MNKLRVIDLLNKIANGEEVPKRIRIRSASGVYDKEFYFDGDIYKYKDEYEEYAMTDDISIEMSLNDEVEILEEEKKIPEKLDVISWDKCIHGVTHKEKELAIEINKTQELLNQVIDYLKSKGE